MTQNHRWKILEERLLLDKRPWLRVTEQTVRLPDGRVIDDYLLAEAPSYASIFPVLPDGRILAVEEYKHGIGRVVLQLPAGILDPGEDALTGARRELLEETGYEAGEWQEMGSFYDDSNRGMSLGHYFFATDLTQVAEPNAGDLDEVRPIVLTPTELRAAIRAGRVTTAGVIACMMLGLEMLEQGARGRGQGRKQSTTNSQQSTKNASDHQSPATTQHARSKGQVADQNLR